MFRNIICFIFLSLFVGDAPLLMAQGQYDEWRLVFSDDFNKRNGNQPDSAKWSRCQRNPSIWARWISPSKDVVFIKNGHLVCRAVPNKNEPADSALMLTGAIESFKKFSFKYGKVEIRMKTNLLQGNFPAVWMIPIPEDKDRRYGEIDIVEMFGNKNQSHHTIHTHQTFTLKTKKPTEFIGKIDIRKWHVYGIEWMPDKIVWTIDGKRVGTYRKSEKDEDIRDGQWTFDREFYIRLNQSVGNGSQLHFIPILNKIYETRFDWIRVYQKRDMP